MHEVRDDLADREQLTQLWVDSRAALLRYRDIARVSLGDGPRGPHARRVAECTEQLLRAGGVTDVAVARAVDVVGLYVTASAVGGAADALPRDDDERFRFGLELLVGGLAALATAGPSPADP